MAEVSFDHVVIRYPGADKPTVPDLTLTIHDGEFLVLVGPSGCGKSTTLRAVAGLEDISGGSININGRDVTGLEPGERDIAMVFQDYALYPHMSVEDNMGFALKVAKRPRQEIKDRVQRAAQVLGLEELLHRKPKDLSGGQRQRVAMGRAIVREPQVFLMDEPLSNLDAKLRVQTRAQIVKLQRDTGVTTIYVTHDQVEAMTMGDRVAVLHEGVLQQVDTPKKLYNEPANAFVAGFIGSPAMNLIELDYAQLPHFANWNLSFSTHKATAGEQETPLQKIIVGIRPEELDILPASSPGIPGTVAMVEELGADAFVYTDTDHGTIIARLSDADATVSIGDSVTITPRTGARIHYFDGDSPLHPRLERN